MAEVLKPPACGATVEILSSHTRLRKAYTVVQIRKSSREPLSTQWRVEFSFIFCIVLFPLYVVIPFYRKKALWNKCLSLWLQSGLMQTVQTPCGERSDRQQPKA